MAPILSMMLGFEKDLRVFQVPGGCDNSRCAPFKPSTEAGESDQQLAIGRSVVKRDLYFQRRTEVARGNCFFDR
jgi:hypothetical protein